MNRPESNTELEDRVYELMDAMKPPDEIAEELGITNAELARLMGKVIAERGDPNLKAARRAREELAKIRF